MVIYKRALAIYAEALWLRLILYNKKIFWFTGAKEQPASASDTILW